MKKKVKIKKKNSFFLSEVRTDRQLQLLHLLYSSTVRLVLCTRVDSYGKPPAATAADFCSTSCCFRGTNRTRLI